MVLKTNLGYRVLRKGSCISYEFHLNIKYHPIIQCKSFLNGNQNKHTTQYLHCKLERKNVISNYF